MSKSPPEHKPDSPGDISALVRSVGAVEVERRLSKLEADQEKLENSLLERHARQVTIIFSCMAGFVTVCAILVTALGWLSRTESREAAKDMKEEVRNSLAETEGKLQKLAGESFKKPRIEILTRSGLLDGQVIAAPAGGTANFGSLFIRNAGNRKTDTLSIRLFTSAPLASISPAGGWIGVPSLEKDFPTSYYLQGYPQLWIEAQEAWVIADPFSIVLGDTNAICKLQIFYGGEIPAEAKFQITIHK